VIIRGEKVVDVARLEVDERLWMGQLEMSPILTRRGCWKSNCSDVVVYKVYFQVTAKKGRKVKRKLFLFLSCGIQCRRVRMCQCFTAARGSSPGMRC
jgi:hypothetical protein